VLIERDKKILASPFSRYERGKFGLSPAVTRCLQAMVERSIETFGEAKEQAADELAGLVKTCLSIEPDQRPTAPIVAERLNVVTRYLETPENKAPVKPPLAWNSGKEHIGGFGCQGCKLEYILR